MNTSHTQALQKAVAAICPDIHSRVMAQGQLRLQEKQLWWELSCCVLSSQVPYALASAAADRIAAEGTLLRPEKHTADGVQKVLLQQLLKPLPLEGGTRKYRFPAMRAKQLAAAWSVVKQQGGSLVAIIQQIGDPMNLREWLVSEIPGLGPKQASMFLRNVGISYDLAVLDRHVLDYMNEVGLANTPLRSLGTLSAYKRHEIILKDHADKIGYPVGMVDWAIWIVMRVANDLKPVKEVAWAAGCCCPCPEATTG